LRLEWLFEEDIEVPGDDPKLVVIVRNGRTK
jgi:hypothetical protein